MTCPIGVFDASNIIILINVDGVETRIDGYADGDYVSIDQNSDDATVQVGADGRAIANFSADNSVTVRLTLQPHSQSNLFLRQLANTRTQFGISVSSPQTGEFGQSSCALITTTPNLSYGTEAGSREWSIFANDYVDNNVLIAI